MYLIGRALREAVRSLRVKLGAFLITLLMVSLSFMVFNIFIAVSWNLRTALAEEQENVGMEVFLEQSVTDSDAVVLADLISGFEGVRSVYLVSSEEAELIFRRDLPDQTELLDLLGSSFRLPASIQISLQTESRTDERVSALARNIAGLEGVEDVIYGEEYLPGLTGAVEMLRRLVLLAGVVLAVSLSLVVANTVRLAVAEKALTVELMSIVGAPGWFVKLPFLGEGMVTGLVGSAFSLVLTAVVSMILSSTVPHRFLPGKWIAGVLVLGTAAGALGSWIGMRSGIPRPRA